MTPRVLTAQGGQRLPFYVKTDRDIRWPDGRSPKARQALLPVVTGCAHYEHPSYGIGQAGFDMGHAVA
jgi:hypothetical protein